MNRNNGEIDIRKGGDGTNEVCIVYALTVVALILLQRIPERGDWSALEPDHQDLRDIEDDV
jgi:hypothetical protein